LGSVAYIENAIIMMTSKITEVLVLGYFHTCNRSVIVLQCNTENL